MAQSGSFQSLQVCRIRASRLNSVGTPVVGAGNSYVSSAITTVSIQPDYQDGPEIQTENGCGGICAYFKGPDVLKKVNLSFELCDLDVELIELLTTQSIITSGGQTVGGYMLRSGACTTVENNGVSLEFWSKRWDGCSAPGGDDANYPYWHWAFPKAILRAGDMTLENGFLRVPIQGYGQENANWGNGPFSDFPAASLDSVGAYFRDATLPTADDTYISTPA